jgi:hypothetical protein
MRALISFMRVPSSQLPSPIPDFLLYYIGDYISGDTNIQTILATVSSKKSIYSVYPFLCQKLLKEITLSILKRPNIYKALTV